MEMNDRYGYTEPARGNAAIYVPLDLDRYIVPAQNPATWKPPSRNGLVEHVLFSIQKNPLQGASQQTIDDIFQDRLTLIRSKIELILLQLDERKKIHRELLYGIAQESCAAQNLINEKLVRSYSMDRERIHLERMKFDLGDQERKEAASYFNDTAMLNRELREALIQYQEEVQKNKMISGMEVSP